MAELGTPERRSGAATRRRTPPASRSARTRAARAGQETASTAVDQGQRVASRAVDHGQQVATTAGRQVRDVAGTAREQAAAVTEDMVDQARGLVDQSRRQVQEQAETQFERVAAGLRRLGGEVQALAEGRPDQAGAMRDYAEQAAERLADVAEAIESKGPTGLLDDLKALARERPGAFVLGAAVAGLAVGRVTRSAAGDDPEAEAEGASGRARRGQR